MSDVRKLYILLCGYEIIRKSACMRGASRAQILAVPICAYALETARGWVLFDTGLDAAPLQDRDEASKLYVNDSFPAPPLVLPEHELLAQLERIGARPDAVSDIILSHAHSDHTGGLKHFPGARVFIQRLEHEAAFSASGRASHAFRDIDRPIRWIVLDGDAEIMPGLDVLLTRGHRPGHQSALVRLPSGASKILVGDVVDLLANVESETLGSCMDDEAGLASLRRLKTLAAETGADLVPLHDPVFVQEARLAPDYYD